MPNDDPFPRFSGPEDPRQVELWRAYQSMLRRTEPPASRSPSDEAGTPPLDGPQKTGSAIPESGATPRFARSADPEDSERWRAYQAMLRRTPTPPPRSAHAHHPPPAAGRAQDHDRVTSRPDASLAESAAEASWEKASWDKASWDKARWEAYQAMLRRTGVAAPRWTQNTSVVGPTASAAPRTPGRRPRPAGRPAANRAATVLAGGAALALVILARGGPLLGPPSELGQAATQARVAPTEQPASQRPDRSCLAGGGCPNGADVRSTVAPPPTSSPTLTATPFGRRRSAAETLDAGALRRAETGAAPTTPRAPRQADASPGDDSGPPPIRGAPFIPIQPAPPPPARGGMAMAFLDSAGPAPAPPRRAVGQSFAALDDSAGARGSALAAARRRLATPLTDAELARVDTTSP